MFQQEAPPLKLLPVKLGFWTSEPQSPGEVTKTKLNGIAYQGKAYKNPYVEWVTVYIFAHAQAEADRVTPATFLQNKGYQLTAAQSQQPFYGKNPVVKAEIFSDGENRVLGYRWTIAPSPSNPNSLTVWLQTRIHPADIKAAQARRNLNELGRLLVDFLSKHHSIDHQKMDPPSTGIAQGSDATYLTSSLKDDKPGYGTHLLPLSKGSSWEMRSTCEGKISQDRLLVTGPVTDGKVRGIEISIQREGKKWRREIYLRQGNQWLLSGLQDEDSTLMGYYPAIPLFEEPVQLGKVLAWSGTFLYRGSSKPAVSYSRVSNKDTVTTAVGRLVVYRIDTLIIVQPGDKEIRFPMVRWLAPGIGFVSRGFADKGRPAFSELTAYKIR